MQWAEAGVVADAAESWTDAQIACRTNGHAWRDAAVSHRPGLYTIRQRCSRNCGCWREADMNEHGFMVSRWKTTYPQPRNGGATRSPYLMPRGSGRVGPDGAAVLRLQRIRSVTVVEVSDE